MRRDCKCHHLVTLLVNGMTNIRSPKRQLADRTQNLNSKHATPPAQSPTKKSSVT